MNMFPFNFEFSEKECPSLYEESEHPSELLQSINNKLDKEDTIIENQKVQISELKQQNYKLQEQIDFAKHEAQQANLKAAKSEQKKQNFNYHRNIQRYCGYYYCSNSIITLRSLTKAIPREKHESANAIVLFLSAFLFASFVL